MSETHDWFQPEGYANTYCRKCGFRHWPGVSETASCPGGQAFFPAPIADASPALLTRKDGGERAGPADSVVGGAGAAIEASGARRMVPTEERLASHANLAELVRRSAEAFAALSPVDKAILHIRQRQSYARAEMRIFDGRLGGLSEARLAALPADPAVTLADEVERLRKLLAAETAFRRRVRHVKRGSTYLVVGLGKLQTSTPISEGALVAFYRSEVDGEFWARPLSEFEDGRFVDIEMGPSP